VRALAGSRHLKKLEILDLSDNNIRDGGAQALAASSALANLRALDVRQNRLTDIGKQALRDKFGDRVKC
jgi:Leucine-rich repeat (LRR) protein